MLACFCASAALTRLAAINPESMSDYGSIP